MTNILFLVWCLMFNMYNSVVIYIVLYRVCVSRSVSTAADFNWSISNFPRHSTELSIIYYCCRCFCLCVGFKKVELLASSICIGEKLIAPAQAFSHCNLVFRGSFKYVVFLGAYERAEFTLYSMLCL